MFQQNYDPKTYYQSLDKIRMQMIQISTQIHGYQWRGLTCPPDNLIILQALLLILTQKMNPKRPYHIQNVLKSQNQIHKTFIRNFTHYTDMVLNYYQIDPLQIPSKSKQVARQYLKKKSLHLNSFQFNRIIQGTGILFDWTIIAMNSESYCQEEFWP